MPEEALLIIDMLDDFVTVGAPLEVPEARRALPNIKREILRAREKGSPVIYVSDSHEPGDAEFSRFGWPPHAVRGTKGAEVVGEIAPEEGDILVEKATYSGFHSTKLDEVLRGLGVKALRLTGCVTHICVLFTASDAVLRGYKVSVVADSVAGLERKDHDAALRIMKNVLGADIV